MFSAHIRLLAFLLFCAIPAHALSVVQHASGQASATSATATFGSAVTNGNTIDVAIGCTGMGNTDFTVSDGTNTYTRLATQSQSNFQLQTWESQNVSGSPTAVMGSLGGCTVITVIAIEVSSLTNGGQPDVTNNSGSVQTNPPIQAGSVTNTSANEIFIVAVAAFIPPGTNTWSIDSGYTIPESPFGGYLSLAYKIVSSTGATNPQWSCSGGAQYLYANIVGLKAPASGASMVPRRR